MIRDSEPESQKGVLAKQPRLGGVSRLILVGGIFLILFIPLWLIHQQQPAKQAELRATLSNLQKVLAVQENPKEKFEAEIKQTEAELEAAKAVFPNPNQSPEIIEGLLKLAKLNDIAVTEIKESSSKKKIGQDKSATEWPVLTFDIKLTGQVPKFQNFLLALDGKFTTCQIREATITIAKKEGEEDTASLKIDVFCYESSK